MAEFVKKHKKGVKIFLIVFLSLAVLASGAIIAFNVIMSNVGKSPEVRSATDDFEYETYGALKNAYVVPESEAGMSVEDYGKEQGYNLYRRAYSRFLSRDAYYVVTEGYTNAAGVYVNVNNSRKFDGTNYYMHLKSLARDQSIFSAASNNNAEHFLYVTENANDNLAAIKKLDPYDDSKMKGEKTVLTERDYVFNYGNLPYAVCVYLINENTVTDSVLEKDAESGLYKLSLTLDAKEASVRNVKYMYAVSGVKVSYDNGKIEYCVYMDGDFNIRKVTVAEEYSVTAIGITMGADAGLCDRYFYPGDDGFEGLSEAEKYDVKDIPVKVDASVSKALADSARTAIEKVAVSGVNSDFELEAGGLALCGRLQVALKDDLIIDFDTDVNGNRIALHLELAEDNSGNVILSVNGAKICVRFTDLGNLVNAILDKAGVSLPLNVGKMINGLDVKSMLKGLATGKGRDTDGGVVYSSNLNGLGIPVDVPISYVVKDGKIVRFSIDDREIGGTRLNLVMTPSEEEFSAIRRTTEDCCDLTDIVYALFKDVSPLGEITDSKSAGVTLSGNIAGYALNGSAAVSFGENVKASLSATLGSLSLGAYFEDGTVYLTVDDFACKASVETIKEYVSEFGFGNINADGLLNSVLSAVSEIRGNGNGVEIPFGDLTVGIGDNKISAKYGDTVELVADGFGADKPQSAPERDYVDLADFTTLVKVYKEKIGKIIEEKTVSFALRGEALGYSAELDVKVGFRDGVLLSAEGCVAGKDVGVYLENGVLYLCLDGANFRISLDSVKEYASVFSEMLPDFGGLDAEKLIPIIVSALASGNIENGVFNVEAFGVGVSVFESGVSLALGDNLAVSVTEIGTAPLSEKPDAEYISLDGLKDLLLALQTPLSEIAESKTVRAAIHGEFFGIEADGEFAIGFGDFGDLKVSLDLTVNGLPCKMYLTDGVVYADIDGLLYKISLDDIADYVRILGIELPAFEFDPFDAAIGVLRGITVDGSFVACSYGQLNAELSPKGISVNYADKVKLLVDGIRSAAVDEVPFAEYKNLGDYKGLIGAYADRVNNILRNKSVSANFEGKIDNTVLSGGFALEFSDGIKLSANVDAGDTAIGLYISDGILYVASDIVSASLSLEELKEYTAIFVGGTIPSEIDFGAAFQAVLSALKNSSFTGGVYSLEIGGAKVSAYEDYLTVGYGDITATLTDIGTEKAENRPQIKYTDLDGLGGLISVVKDPIMVALKEKRVGASFVGTLFGINVSGDFAVNFEDTDDLKAQATLNVDGAEISLYYDDRFYVVSGEFALSFDLATVLGYAGIFTEVPDVDATDLFSEVINALSSLTVNDGNLSLSVKGVFAELTENGIGLSYGDKTNISVSGFGTGEIGEMPQRTYKDISGLEPLLEKVRGQLDNRYFNFDVTVKAGAHTLTIKNVKVENQGELSNPTKAFDDGLLRLKGTVVIDGKHTISVTYANKTLYADYNGIKVLFDRPSLDYVVDIILKNYRDILKTFNYSNLFREGLLEELANVGVGSAIKMICGISAEKGGLSLQIDASRFDFGTVTMAAAIDGDGNLFISGTIGDGGSVSVKMNNNAFGVISSPSGSYINLSQTKYLIEGLVNAVLKKEEAYYLDGKAAINLVGDLGLTFGLTASVRFADIVENGKVTGGKDVEVVITLKNTDKFFGELATEAILQSYIKYGTATLCIRRGVVYIERTDYKYSWFNMKKDGTSYRKMTTAYFAKNALNQIAFFTGLTSKITDKFSSSTNISTNGLIKSYTGSASLQKIVINGKNIDSALDENMPFTIGITERTVTAANGENIREKQLTSISSQFDIVSILTANISFTHHLDKTGNFNEIGLLNTKYANTPLLVA